MNDLIPTHGPPPAAPSTPVVGKARLVVLETVYYQSQDDSDPIVSETKYSQSIQSDEQPYSRWQVVAETPQPVDCGWVENACLLVIRNSEKDPSKVIRIQAGPTILVRPGTSLRVEVSDAKQLTLRCASGSAKCHVLVIPR